MSREPYGPSAVGPSAAGAGGAGGARSPRSRRSELPTVDRSPSRGYPPRGRGPPSPDPGYPPHHRTMGSPYYGHDEPPSPEERRGHRSRSATRPSQPLSVRYQSLDRERDRDREFLPIREPRERSLERGALRDRSLERGLFLEEGLYGARSARQSPALREPGGVFIGELQHQNTDLQRELGNLKKELELTNQKLGSSMHSIKTFWSPELKKERALRKEESAKYSLINDQLKLLNNENQKQAMLVRQLEEELRLRMRAPSLEMQQQMEVLFAENEHLTREISILRDTIKELEIRIETQKQTIQARDESIKKLLEMLQNKGMGCSQDDLSKIQIESLRAMLQEIESRSLYLSLMMQREAAAIEMPVSNKKNLHASWEMAWCGQLDEFRVEIQRRDQEILGMAAKMKTLEEQHQDYQRHIAVLKESLCAKEEHYNMLQADVEELRTRLEEKNRLIEKKTQSAMQATQERNRIGNELTEIKDHMDIKDRKINVLQRKLDLLEANKKLQSAGQQNARAGDDTAAARKQLQEEFRKLEEQKKHTDEQRRNFDAKRKEVEEKEKALTEMDRQLKKRKEQMDQLEASLKKAGGSAAAAGELNKKLTDSQKEADALKQKLHSAQEEAQRSSAEMERLLQLVQMSQEEQNAKEKQIMEMQQSIKNLQAKLRNQQQVNAQMEEQRKKDEQDTRTCYICKNCSKAQDKNKYATDLNKDVSNTYNVIKNISDQLNDSEELKLKSETIDITEELDYILNRLQHFIAFNLNNSTDESESIEKGESNGILSGENQNKHKEKLSNLMDELGVKNSKIIEQQNCIQLLENALRESSNIAELEQLLIVIKSKDERINEIEHMIKTPNLESDDNVKDERIIELEEALKESVIIAAEREKIFYDEEKERLKMAEMIKKLEQRLLSSQNARSLQCDTCRPLLSKVNKLEECLKELSIDRREQLQDLCRMRQEALEASISEKDAHLALLEMSGIKNAKQADDCEQLRKDKARLMERLRLESEQSIKLLHEINSLQNIPPSAEFDVDSIDRNSLLKFPLDNMNILNANLCEDFDDLGGTAL